MNDLIDDEQDCNTPRKDEAMKALAFIEAELADLGHIPADTWSRLHAAFDRVRAALLSQSAMKCDKCHG